MTKKNRTAKGQPFKSRYYGECGICNEIYEPGEVITRLLTGYYRLEDTASKFGGGSYQRRINRFYAHVGCTVQAPAKPGWLPDRYLWCTVCNDWWDKLTHRGTCEHTQPWWEQAKRKRWKKQHED